VAKIPVSLSKAMNAWKEVSSNADQSVNLVLAGDHDLVAIAQEKFSAGGTVPATWVGPLPELSGLAGGSGDILLVLIAADKEAEALAVLEEGPSKGGVVLAVKGGVDTGGRFTRPWKGCIRLAFSDDATGWRQVFGACAQLADDRVVGLGRRYPALRGAAAQRVISQTAGQNALIGLVFILPGADMPAMTLNQLKMVLYLSAMYGGEIGVDRAIEILGVVAMGFGFRGLARKIVGQVPGFGWVYRAIVGYTATVAVGMAAVKYFELGAPASTEKAIALVRSLKS
jgi:uncharacterized protein (DUF697 family)